MSAALALPSPGPRPSPRRPLDLVLLALVVVLALTTVALAFQKIAAGVLPGGQSYSQSQVAGFFANSSNPYLASNASSFAAMSHNVEDPNGNTGTYNGSCCSGLMQINQTNLKNYCNCTPQQFATMSGQDQVNVYTKYYEGEIQNSSGVKQLQQMQASGQTLGGQKVDGAMIAACAQLGAGNCAAAIRNNCSSKANGSGGDGSVNVCTMAAKADNGAQVTAPPASSTPSTTPSTSPTTSPSTTPGSSTSPSTSPTTTATTPTDSATTTASMPVGDPTICWLCDATVDAMSVLSLMATSAVPTVAAEFWPLAVSLVMFGLVYRILFQVVAGQPPLRGVAGIALRLAVVGALLGATAVTTGSTPSATGTATLGQAGSMPDDSSGGSGGTVQAADGLGGNGAVSGDNFVTDWVLTPPISLGSAVGVGIAAVAAPAVGLTAPQTSNCQYTQPSTSGAAALSTATTDLVGLVCYVHVAGSYGAAAGAALLSARLNATTLLDDLAAMLFIVAGFMMTYLGVSTMLSFGGALVEAIVRLALVVAFLPLFLVLAIFDSTRQIATHAARSLLFTFLFLALTGAGSVVAMFVAAKAMQLGLGQSSGSLDPVALSTTAQSTMSGLDVTQASSYATLVKFFGFDAIGFLMASRVLSSMQDLAAKLSSYEEGRAGAMASAPAAMARRIGTVGLGLAGTAGAVGARVAGKLAGGLVRGAGHAAGHAATGVATGVARRP